MSPNFEPYHPDAETLEARRKSIDVNLFQGNDVRGDAEAHAGRATPNFLPDDAYLIAREIGIDFCESPSSSTGEDSRARALVAGDHRPSTPSLLGAVARGLADAGFHVYLADEPVPTGVTSRRALTDDVDVAIQITGSHNPSYNNGLKITTKQSETGHDWNGVPSALYGDKRRRPFELIHIYDRLCRDDVTPLEFPDDSVARIYPISNIMSDYTRDMISYFRSVLDPGTGQFRRRFKVVVDPGNGLGALALPLLEALGVELAPMFTELDGTFPNHPADPSAHAGVVAAQDEVARRNASLGAGSDGERWFGLVFDGDGDRAGLIDEDGRVVYGERLLVVTYMRFLLENQEILGELNAFGHNVGLALDVRGATVVEDVIRRFTDSTGIAVDTPFIPAGYPHQRTFVRQQIGRIVEVAEQSGLAGDPRIAHLIRTYTSAEASGHFFYATAPESRYPELVIDDGIFTAVMLLYILDSVEEYEVPFGLVPAKADGVIGCVDLFGAAPRYPISQDIRGAAPYENSARIRIIEEINRQVADGSIQFKYPIATVLGIDTTEDAVRVHFSDNSFLMVRASNTSPKFTYKFEARSEVRLVELIEETLPILARYAAAGVDSSAVEAERERILAEIGT